MGAAAGAGWRALAPDLPGYGDSEPDPPHTWTRMVDAVEAFWRSASRAGRPRGARLGRADRPALGVRPPRGRARAVISDTGFFPDGKWHGMAETLRTAGRARSSSPASPASPSASCCEHLTGIDDDAVDEYYKAFGDDVRRRGQLELYRSGEFSELEAYEGSWPGSACRR